MTLKTVSGSIWHLANDGFGDQDNLTNNRFRK